MHLKEVEGSADGTVGACPVTRPHVPFSIRAVPEVSGYIREGGAQARGVLGQLLHVILYARRPVI